MASGQTLGSSGVIGLTPGTAVPAAVEAARVALRSPGPAILLGAGFAVVEGLLGRHVLPLPGPGSAHAGMLARPRRLPRRDVAAGRWTRLVRRGHDPLSQVMEEPDRLGEVLWAQLAVLGGGIAQQRRSPRPTA